MLLTLFAIGVQVSGGMTLLRLGAHRRKVTRYAVYAAVLLMSGVLLAGFFSGAIRVAIFLGPLLWPVRLFALVWLLLSVPTWICYQISKLLPKVKPSHSPARRRFLTTVRGALLAAPAATTAYAIFVQRSDFRIREIDMPIPGLPKELHGLRLVQLSDIHLSPFLTEKELARAVDMANETKAHIGLITGDLITSRYDPLDECLEQLSRLKTEAGSLGCMGNHEGYAGVQRYTAEQGVSHGIQFLRNESKILEFRGQRINFAGVDYQKMNSVYLPGAEKLVQPGMVNLLLSHNPDVFPVAAEKGFQGVFAGHTHGGQITVEILSQDLNVARFYTPYVYGLYRRENSSAWVTRGIGTVGIPARLGAPPEVALIRLCAT